jgi:hypothetical protein
MSNLYGAQPPSGYGTGSPRDGIVRALMQSPTAAALGRIANPPPMPPGQAPQIPGLGQPSLPGQQQPPPGVGQPPPLGLGGAGQAAMMPPSPMTQQGFGLPGITPPGQLPPGMAPQAVTGAPPLPMPPRY